MMLGGIGMKTYQNVYNKPIVTAPSGYVVRRLKQKGISSSWVVDYSKINQMNLTQSFKISSSTSSINVGGNIFRVDWP